MPPYSQLIAEFQKGDVLFGMSEDLAIVESSLKQLDVPVAGFKRFLRCCCACMASEPKKAHRKTDVFVQSNLTNAVYNPSKLKEGKPYQSGELIASALPHESDRGESFQEFLQNHAKYDVRFKGGTPQEDGEIEPFGAQVQDVDYYNNYKPGDENNPKPQWVKDKVWKRTSKAGLEFQTTRRQRTVHFLLDKFLVGENMRAAVLKDGQHGGRTITSGELRWIYRNWDNPLVSGHVIFWTTTGRSDPPWVLDPDLWSLYKPKGRRTEGGSDAIHEALPVHD
jgi:hypothetical protein